jgi:hypothetical protein
MAKAHLVLAKWAKKAIDEKISTGWHMEIYVTFFHFYFVPLNPYNKIAKYYIYMCSTIT